MIVADLLGGVPGLVFAVVGAFFIYIGLKERVWGYNRGYICNGRVFNHGVFYFYRTGGVTINFHFRYYEHRNMRHNGTYKHWEET